MSKKTERKAMQMRQIVSPLILLIILLQLGMTAALYEPASQTLAQSISIPKYINSDDLALLTQNSSQIIRGRVLSTESYWNSDRSAIETDSVIQVLYQLAGIPVTQLTIHSDGGFLPEENVGMRSTKAPTFREEEELLLFLHEDQDRYIVTKGELGKYSIGGTLALNALTKAQMALDQLYSEVEQTLVQQERISLLPINWVDLEPNKSNVPNLQGADFVYKDRKWSGSSPNIPYKININTDQVNGTNGTAESFQNAIIAAAETWNNVPTSDFTLTYAGETTATSVGFNGSNEVLFMNKGTDTAVGMAQFWFIGVDTIIEADIWLNDDMIFDATGSPNFNEADLQSIVLHEFGHWLALGHDDSDNEAVMAAAIPGGTLRRTLTPHDVEGISFIYPCAEEPCASMLPSATDSVSPTTVTPTGTPTPLPTPTNRNTPTPTMVPIDTPTDTPTEVIEPTATATDLPIPTETNMPTDTPTSVPATTPMPTAVTAVPAATSATTSEVQEPATEEPLPTATRASTVTPDAISTITPTSTTAPVPTATDEPIISVIPTSEGPSTEVEVSPNQGETLAHMDGQSMNNILNIPANAVTAPILLRYVELSMPSVSQAEFDLKNVPPTGYGFSQKRFRIEAYRNNKLLPNFEFETTVGLTIQYKEATISGLEEETLELYYWDEEEQLWEDASCGTPILQMAINQVYVPICHLTEFALIGIMAQEEEPTATPSPTPLPQPTLTPTPISTPIPTDQPVEEPGVTDPRIFLPVVGKSPHPTPDPSVAYPPPQR